MRFLLTIFIGIGMIGTVLAQPDLSMQAAKQDTVELALDPAEAAYQKRIRKSRLNGVYIPKDLYDAFAQLERLMDAPTRRAFKNMTEEEAGKKLYLIMWMANNWGFYEGSRLSHYLSNMGISDPEHKAHFIITTYHRRLNGKELDMKSLVDFYADFLQKRNAKKAQNKK